MKIIIPKGIKVGHAQNDFTGITVFLSEKGCVCGVSIKGNAPATRETDLLASEKAVQKANAIFLSGGSAFGLSASVGIMDFLLEKNSGYKIGKKCVPIVSGACLYDLNTQKYHYPDRDMGYTACQNAYTEPLKMGQYGAGTGATVGKIRGVKYASKGGIGAATVKCGGITVTAVVAVNALGDIYDGATNKIIAGAKANDGSFIDTEKCILENKFLSLILGNNTTIGCIMTNAKLSKLQANKLASLAHNGYARVIKPAHTDYDGDAIFTMSTNKVPLINFTMLQIAATNAVQQAVLNAVSDQQNVQIIYDEETVEE